LGMEKQLGRIAAGRPAHLTVFSGEFQEPSSQVKYLFVDGLRFEFDGRPDGQPEGGPRRANRDRGADDRRPENNRTADARSDDKKDDAQPSELPTEIEADRHPQLKTGGNCLLKNATLITVANGSQQGDLLIKNGKIAQLGSNLAAPDGV